MDTEKLAKLQAQVRMGGKGTPRRKVFKKPKAASGIDKKLEGFLKSIDAVPLSGIQEVTLFQAGGKVLNIENPKVHGNPAQQAYAVHGEAVEKELTDLVPSILNQLGPDSLASLRRLAEAYQSSQGAAEGENDEIPELTEALDDAAIADAPEAEAKPEESA